jgi:hypothetical protein
VYARSSLSLPAAAERQRSVTKRNPMDSKIIVEDAVSLAERAFPFSNLLSRDYFQKYKHAYYHQQELGHQIPIRSYLNLLEYLTEISSYKPEHGNSFAKRFRKDRNNWQNCEAIFAEIIVYRYYIRLVYEGLIKSVALEQRESDVIVERLDGSKAYHEVFCIMPAFVPNDRDIIDIKTHTQQAMSSVRQKLLRKIAKQRQLSKPRDNFAVIELNDVSIAGDFSVLSSLSSGYKIGIDKNTMQTVERGYDWTNSIFDDESTRYLKGVIYFDLGDYTSRRFLLNPFFKSE